MSFDFKVTLGFSPTPIDAGTLALIQADAEAALRYYGKYFTGLGTFELQINFSALGGSFLAQATPNAYVPALTPDQNGFRMLKPTWLPEFQSGRDFNGVETPEGLVEVNTDFLSRFWFDPTPDDRSDPIPTGKSDFLGILTHELGHVFGFDSARNLDGSFPTNARTIYDLHVSSATGLYDSPAMREAMGGPVGVDTTHGDGSRWAHLANAADIMFWQENRVRSFSLADLAVFHDEGMVSATPDATDNVWFGVDGAADTVDGGAGNDTLFGLDGDDVIAGGAGDDFIAGGTGFDTAIFAQSRAAAAVVRNGDGTITVSGTDGTDTLRDVEVLRFSDRTMFNATGADATVARLYGAAFARPPDAAGLEVQLNALHAGTSALQLASNFIGSAEFVARYGAGTTDTQFVTALYNNVLGRIPDQGGFNVQVDALAHGLARAQLLLNFGESAENQAKVAADWLLA